MLSDFYQVSGTVHHTLEWDPHRRHHRQPPAPIARRPAAFESVRYVLGVLALAVASRREHDAR